MIKNTYLNTAFLIIFIFGLIACGTNSQEWINEAKSRLEKGNLSEAKTAIENALEVNPENAQAHNLLGVIAYQMEDFDLAIQEFKKAVNLDPSNLNAQLNLANQEMELENWQEAKKILDFLLINGQINPEIYLKKGIALAGLGKVEEAVQDFSMVIELDSSNYDAHYNRGNIYFQKESFSIAIKDFEACIKIGDNTGKAFYALGLSYFRINEIEKSCLALKEAKELGYSDANEVIDQVCL